jgi:hypothetical protein
MVVKEGSLEPGTDSILRDRRALFSTRRFG